MTLEQLQEKLQTLGVAYWQRVRELEQTDRALSSIVAQVNLMDELIKEAKRQTEDKHDEVVSE